MEEKKVNLVRRSDYKGLREGELVGYPDTLLSNAVGPLFEPFRTILDELDRRKSVYATAYSKLATGGPPETQAKNIAKKALYNQLDIYANAIDTAAVDNPSIILLAGFKQRNYKGKGSRKQTFSPIVSINLSSKSEMPGQVHVSLNVPNYKKNWTYLIESMTMPDGVWKMEDSTSLRDFYINGLTSGKSVKVRARILSSNGYSDYTESNEIYVF